jgi:hypothetical protein
MTAKQRAARAKFKAVVAEAKKLRKKNPKLTQAQAVKQAWAISYSKGLKGEKLGAAKKAKYEIGDMVYSYQNKNYKAPISYKKFVPWESLSKPSAKDKFVYKLKIKDGFSNWINEESLSKSILGAAPTKVKAKKSKRTSEMHTDTKSHNVNIRVVSGVPRPKKFIKIPLKEKAWFRKYVYGFYGKKGVQASNLMNNGFTRKELNDRLNMFFKIQHDKGYDSWNRGDSVDRERFRDMFLMDQIKKGQYIY